MSTLTKSDLYDAVAAKMDKLQADYSTAEKTQIEVWAIDCLQWLLPLAPEYAIESILTSVSAQDEPLTISSGLTNCMKVVRVAHNSDGDIAKYVEPDQFSRISNAYGSGTNSYETGFRIWSNIMGAISVFRIGAAETIDVDYIQEPAWGAGFFRDSDDDTRTFEMLLDHNSNADNRPPDAADANAGADWELFWAEKTYSNGTNWITGQTYAGAANITIPNGWDGLVAGYCAVQAKMKDEEPQLAKASWDVFLQELSRFGGFEDIAKSVGG